MIFGSFVLSVLGLIKYESINVSMPYRIVVKHRCLKWGGTGGTTPPPPPPNSKVIDFKMLKHDLIISNWHLPITSGNLCMMSVIYYFYIGDYSQLILPYTKLVSSSKWSLVSTSKWSYLVTIFFTAIVKGRIFEFNLFD